MDLSKEMNNITQDGMFKVLIDFSMYKYKALFGTLKHIDGVEHPRFKQAFAKKFINEVLTILTPNIDRIDEVIVCYDFGNFRTELQQNYKQNRTITRDASGINYEYFNEFFNEFTKDFIKMVGFNHLRIFRFEGDDTLATVIIRNPTKNYIIASSDKDFFQLRNHCPNIIQINPVKLQVVGDKSWYDLRIHYCTGDKSDNVFQLQKGVGVKTVEKMIKAGTLDSWIDDNGYRELYEHNRLMVDLSLSPKDLQEECIEKYNSYVPHFSKLNITKFNLKYGTELNYNTLIKLDPNPPKSNRSTRNQII